MPIDNEEDKKKDLRPGLYGPPELKEEEVVKNVTSETTKQLIDNSNKAESLKFLARQGGENPEQLQKNVELNIKRSENNAGQPTVKDNFMNSLAFFLPSIVGGVVGKMVGGDAGAGKGAELGLKAGTDLAKLNQSQQKIDIQRFEGDAKRRHEKELKGIDSDAKIAIEKSKNQTKGLETADKLTNKLRDRWEKDDITKSTKVVVQAFKKIKKSATGKVPTGASDLALVFNFMKVLDPGSVVRESEFANAANTEGIPPRLLEYRNKLLKGTLLTPTQRENFLNESRKLLVGQKDVQDTVDISLIEEANARGANPKYVTNSYFSNLLAEESLTKRQRRQKRIRDLNRKKAGK